MQKSDIKVLIVEDDSTLGPAVQEAVSRAGYSAELASNPVAAKKAFKVNDFQAVIADCMLPGQNGVDMAKELRKEINGQFLLVLMSGIFKDKSHIKDSIKKTGAVHYFTKPFNLEELIELLDEQLGKEFDTEREPLYESLSTKNLSQQDRIRAVQQTSSIHGYDLPHVYTLFMDSGFSGTLQISYPEGDPAELGFDRGRISKVIHPDTESYFGVLLVENGFTSHEEVQENLAQENSKPIGQRLIESGSLSPHAIQIVQHQQMVIRLSKTIQDTSVQLEVTSSEDGAPEVTIENFHFTPLLNDWITTKLGGDWLKAFYLSWLDYPVLEGPESAKLGLVKSLPLLQQAPGIEKVLQYPSTLQELLDSNAGTPEEDLLRALHFLLLQRVLIFGTKTSGATNHDNKIARLEKIKEAMADQNYFERLGLSNDARQSEIERSYKDLAKALHPDKLPPDSPAELIELAKEVFSLVSTAYQALQTSEAKKKYLKELKNGIAEDILKSESLFEEGLKHLNGGRYLKAKENFKSAGKVKGHRSDLLVYLTWAKIKSGQGERDFSSHFKSIRKLLSRIPHEERHTPVFFFVRGLYYVLKQDYEKANAFFKHAATLDPYFIEAKREMSSLRRKLKSEKSQITSEITSVVTKVFSRTGRKKKRGA